MAQKNTINIRADVTQIIDGRKYKGNICFDECNFQYQLEFDIPIDKLDEIAERNPEDVMGHIHLGVIDAQKRVVDGAMNVLCMAIAGDLAIDFYHAPQTRDANSGLLGTHPCVSGLENLSLSTHIERRLLKSPELEKILGTYRE
jgi:hypothetical protein